METACFSKQISFRSRSEEARREEKRKEEEREQRQALPHPPPPKPLTDPGGLLAILLYKENV